MFTALYVSSQSNREKLGLFAKEINSEDLIGRISGTESIIPSLNEIWEITTAKSYQLAIPESDQWLIFGVFS